MAAYIVASVRVTDPAKFGAYVKAIAGVSEAHGGEYMVRGKVAEVLEGDVDSGEMVIISRFPTAGAARAYIASSEYQAGKKLREGAAVVETRLLIDPV